MAMMRASISVEQSDIHASILRACQTGCIYRGLLRGTGRLVSILGLTKASDFENDSSRQAGGVNKWAKFVDE